MNDPAEEIVGIYRRHAKAWSRARGTSLIEGRWLATFLSYAPAGGVVLDLGCGPGVPIARHMIDHGFAVYGVDGSPEMVSLFRRNVAGAQAKVADMRGLDLGRRFDGVLAWGSFFHLRPQEQRAMFAVFAAHAKPGAPLMFTSGPSAGIALGELEGETLRVLLQLLRPDPEPVGRAVAGLMF